MIVEKSSLFDVLERLGRILYDGNPLEEYLDAIKVLIQDHSFESDENTPDWLINFFHDIIKKENTGIVKFVRNQEEGELEVADFLHEIGERKSYFKIDRFDYQGESVEMHFDVLGLSAMIFFEGNYYTIKKDVKKFNWSSFKNKPPLWLQALIVISIVAISFVGAWYYTQKSGQHEVPDWFVNMNRWLGPITLGWLIFIAIGTVFTLFRALVKHLKS